MIREAVLGDIPRLIPMGRCFFNSVNWPDGVTFSPEVFSETCRHLIDGDNGVIFISPGGMVGGIVYPLFFSGQTCCQEVFWWASDGTGKALFKALRGWFMKRADFTTMVALDKRVGKLYERLGYMPTEHHYMRAV